MSMESFPILCPCSQCKPSRLRQCLILIGPGKFFCPQSNQVVAIMGATVDRAEREKRKALRGTRYLRTSTDKRLK